MDWQQLVLEQAALIKQLRVRISDAEAIAFKERIDVLDKNSGNSSKRPSDIVKPPKDTKPNGKGTRKGQTRKPQRSKRAQVKFAKTLRCLTNRQDRRTQSRCLSDVRRKTPTQQRTAENSSASRTRREVVHRHQVSTSLVQVRALSIYAVKRFETEKIGGFLKYAGF